MTCSNPVHEIAKVVYRLKFSMVVPCFNNVYLSKRFLDDCLIGCPTTNLVEVVMVSDGSTDSTEAWFQNFTGSFVRGHHYPTNRGFAAAVNRGVELAKSEYVVIANNDLVLNRQTFPALLKSFELMPENFGVLGNVQRRVSDNSIHHAGMHISKEGLFLHREHIPPEQVSQCALVTGAFMLFKKSVFLEVGGFDENYRNGCEDIDLCLRLLDKGHTNWIVNGSMVHHHVAATRGVSIQEQHNLHRLLTTRSESLQNLMRSSFPDCNPQQILDQALNRITQQLRTHQANQATSFT